MSLFAAFSLTPSLSLQGNELAKVIGRASTARLGLDVNPEPMFEILKRIRADKGTTPAENGTSNEDTPDAE